MTIAGSAVRRVLEPWRSVLSPQAAVVCGVCLGSGMGLGAAEAGPVKYRVDFDVTWSLQTHPGAIRPNSHFDSFAGANHSSTVSFWRVGDLASPGVKQEAELGFSPIFDQELGAAVSAAAALSRISEPGWICPDDTTGGACREPGFLFEVDRANPLVSFAAMIGPSPDWFVGVSGLSLRDNDAWVGRMVLDIFPYDAGTRSNNDTFHLGGPLNNPPEPISLITNATGQLIGGASLGVMTFTLVPEPAAVWVLGLGWLALGKRPVWPR